MLTHDLPVGAPNCAEIGKVLLPIGDIPGHSGDVLWACAGSAQDRHDVLESLPELPDEVVVFKAFIAIPTDLAATEDHGLALSDDAVRVTLWTCPALRQQGLVHANFSICNVYVYNYILYLKY